MKEPREPEITLFGRKIVLPETGGKEANAPDGCSGENGGSDFCGRDCEGEKADEDQKLSSTKSQETESNQDAGEEVENPDEGSESSENAKTPSRDEDGLSEDNPKPENEASDAQNGQQKPLKKPDKILPCPRCNSMDTKFCYYNNYNVNQPRHFCKSCQRYWTAGGTMRNVPVGAGRRKNKNSTSHCQHITITEALQAARVDAPNGFHYQAFKPNGTVLSFGPDSPLCESMASAMNLQDKRASSGVNNDYDKIDHGGLRSSKSRQTGDDVLSDGSSVNRMDSKNGPQPSVMQNTSNFSSPFPCIPGVSWPYPWNSAVALPAIYPPVYPIPFYPAAPYWNCAVPNGWNLPWLSVPSPTAIGSNPNSPLGKHTRNGELLRPSCSDNKEHPEQPNSKSAIVIPKTLRIDDPEEAAKSSIWETLGIKYDSIQREGLFKALQPKAAEKKLFVTTSPVIQANPAALSRSFTFHEGA